VLAAESLQRMGYTRVCSMAGGIRAWRAAGYPVEPGRLPAGDAGAPSKGQDPALPEPESGA
jgi:3-mercaptopyruvate sulfurtransferase SseA